MKQLKLHFRKISIQMIFVVIAIFSIIFVLLYYYLVYSNDELVKYFPKDTNAYISFKVDENIISSKFFEKFELPVDMKLKISQLISNDLNQSASRNIAIGLIKEKNKYQPLVIFYLNKKIDPTDPLFTVLKENGYYSFKIENPVFKKNYLVITKSRDFSARIKDVISHEDKSLNKNLLLIFGRQTISDEKGIFYADADIINYYFKDIKELIGVKKSINRPVLTSFSINKERILAITEKYKQNTPIFIPNIDKFDFSLISYDPVNTFNKVISDLGITNNLIEYEKVIGGDFSPILDKNNDISLKYTHFIDKNYIANIKSSNNSELLPKIREEFRDIIAFKEKKDKIILLPDQTQISVKVKNKEEVYFNKNNTLINEKTGDRIYFNNIDSDIVISKNINLKDIKETQIPGCEVDNEAETLIVGSEYLNKIGLFGKIANFGVFSTYTQGYPQFLLCLN